MTPTDRKKEKEVLKISVNVPPVARKVGIHRANQLGVKAGVAPGVASKWWKGDLERIELSVLTRICEICKCDISDILVTTNGATPQESLPAA